MIERPATAATAACRTRRVAIKKKPPPEASRTFRRTTQGQRLVTRRQIAKILLSIGSIGTQNEQTANSATRNRHGPRRV